MVRASVRKLSKKFVRVPSSKVVNHYERKIPNDPTCAIEGTRLPGVAGGKVSSIRKLSKSERRPSVLFGGLLSSKARDLVFEEAIKVKFKIKSIDDVSVSLKKYVKDAINKM